MKNTVLKYDSVQAGDVKVLDYTSRTHDLRNIKKEFPKIAKFFERVTIIDNHTPEKIVFNVYDNPDLWDLLLLINDREPLSGMPYDFDTVRETAKRRFNEFLSDHPRVNLSEKRKEEILEGFLKEIDLENEKKRLFDMPIPDRLPGIILELRLAKKI